MTGVTLVVDVANVVGSRPDGWWRDRIGATSRLLGRLADLADAEVSSPDGARWRVDSVLAVIEGQARGAVDPRRPGVVIVRAARDGDTTIAERAEQLVGDGERVVVVTADRGLRERLPAVCSVAGPGWLRDLIDP